MWWKTEDFILEDSQRLIEQYHDPNPGAMVQIVLAPCSPFSVTAELMRQSASLAREYGVHLHTHLAETQDEEAFCLQKFGYRPVAYMDRAELDRAGCVVCPFGACERGRDCTCTPTPAAAWRTARPPTCAWPRALPPSWRCCTAGVKVGLGVDGSASNDGSNLLEEVRQAMLAVARAGRA